MAEFASRGVGTAALTTGIIGAAGAVGSGGIGNILGGILGGGNNAVNTALLAAMAANAGSLLGNNGGNCSENQPVNRYEMAQEQRIAALESQNALLQAEKNTDAKILDLYKVMDSRMSATNQQLAQLAATQAVTNQKLSDDMAFFRQDLDSKIAAEKQQRCCSDNSIVNYVNATFYPKLVADVTAGNTTTAQATYNPLPNCGPCCPNQAA